jgi:hypothetical protein
VSAKSNDVDEIRRQMVQLRRKHREDVREVIAGAEAVAGWGRHIGLYSWAALGAAAVALWIVANRRKAVPIGEATPLEPAEPPPGVAENRPGAGERLKPPPRWLSDAGNFLLGVALRAAQTYAAHWVDQWFAQQRMRAATRPGPFLVDRRAEWPHGRPARPERHSRAGEGPLPNFVSGGFNDDRSRT